jgi:hypothetical protein
VFLELLTEERYVLAELENMFLPYAVAGRLTMAELKTKQTERSVNAFINQIPDETTRKDCRTIVRLMKKATKSEPRMWGSSIVGFGKFHYKYASGHEGDTCVVGFSPRKQYLTLYAMPGYLPQFQDLLKKLGKHKTGKGCLYIKKLEDVNLAVLEDLIEQAVKTAASRRGGP